MALLAQPGVQQFLETAKGGHNLLHRHSRILRCRPGRWRRRLPCWRSKRCQQGREAAKQWPLDSKSQEGKDLHQAWLWKELQQG